MNTKQTVQYAHAVYPEQDWRHIVITFLTVAILCIITGLALWFWLSRPEHVNVPGGVVTNIKQYKSLADINVAMKQRNENFISIQKKPHAIVDPSVLR